MAFLIIGREDLISRSMIRNPDCVIVLDPTLHKVLPEVTRGIKRGGVYIQNSTKAPKTLMNELNFDTKINKIGVVDATGISIKMTGNPIPNIVMLGSIIKVTEFVSIEAAKEVVKERFPRLADKYVECIREGYEQVNVEVLDNV